jgi:NAD(P)-dependent dehydrogenase (short-subunit alcohol dehydrogenase family)
MVYGPQDAYHFMQGANSILGIGRASAHQFAEHGAKAVYICDYDGSNLEAHKREINDLFPQVDVHTRQFDAADEKAVKEVIDDAMKRYGRLDVFFANAGTTGIHALFTDIEADDFMETMRVNSLGYALSPPSPPLQDGSHLSMNARNPW